MLANIFGMHLGCKIRCPQGEGILTAVDTGDLEDPFLTLDIAIKLENEVESVTFEHEPDRCKLLLKPLSSITEEDKREIYSFTGKVTRDGARPACVEYDKIMDWCVLITKDLNDRENRIILKGKDRLKIRSLGYDIPDGLVPDEYKELEDV